MYDAIVVGAGPAGCACARRLSALGRRVLLVERMKLPREKSCSGILIRKALRLVEEGFGEPVPASVTCRPSDNRGMVFFADSGQEYRFEQPGLNVWRSRFDGWLAQRAATAGAELRDGTAATAMLAEDDGVVLELRGGKRRREVAFFAVLCEGVTAPLTRDLLGLRRNFITTYQTFHRGSIGSGGLDPHYFHSFLQPAFSEYDAWFNVKDDLLVAGVAVRDTAQIARYHAAFRDHLTLGYGVDLGEPLRAERWIMPAVESDHEIVAGRGRVLVAGEAAGFLNPMGEGVSAALESGFAAAEAVHASLASGTAALPDYRARVARPYEYMMRQWSYTGEISERFSHMVRA